MLNLFVVLLATVSIILLVVCVLLYIAQQNAKINEKYSKVLFEQAGNAIFTMDLDSRKIQLSESFESIFGRKIAASFKLNKKFSDVVFNEDKKIFTTAFDRVLNGEDVNDVRFRLDNGDEPPVWCSFMTVVIRYKVRKMNRVIGSFKNIDKQVRLEESLKEKAEHDLLTGIYNKQTATILVENTLIDRAYNNKNNALMIIDIDSLKTINDNFGHAVGDEEIQRLANIMKMVFRESDILGRIGGDEFMAFLKNCGEKKDMIKKAQSVCSLYKTVIKTKVKVFTVTCSIGIAYYPEFGKTFEDLYCNADKALYDVKRSGKNSVALYTADLIR